MVHLIGVGGPGDRKSIDLSTRARNRIENAQEPRRSPAAMTAARDLWTRRFPNLQVRALDSLYNCMGLVFASRRTAIDPDQLGLILKDDEYRRLRQFAEALPGDVAVYRDRAGVATHVGVVLQNDPDLATGGSRLTILSQWGRDGEYIHPVEQVPDAFGRCTEIWTDRA